MSIPPFIKVTTVSGSTATVATASIIAISLRHTDWVLQCRDGWQISIGSDERNRLNTLLGVGQ